MGLRRALVAVIACAAACRTAPAPAPSAEARPPPDVFEAIADAQSPQIAALLRQEAPELPLLPFSSSDGAFSGQVRAQSAPTLSFDENGQVLTVAFSASPMRCYFRPQRIDAAASVRTTVELAMGKELQIAYAQPGVDATPRGAVLSADVIYLAVRNGTKMIGEYKVAVAARDNLSLICTQDQGGYRKSFRKIVNELVESLHGGEPARAPEGEELWLSHLGTNAVGYSHSIWTNDGRGAVVENAFVALLATRDSKVLHAGDRIAHEESLAGKVDSRVVAGVVDGELKLQATLAHGPTGYSVHGRKSGAPFENSFDSAGISSCPPWMDPRYADLRAGRIEQFSIDDWVPDVYPEGTTPRIVKKGPTAGSISIASGESAQQIDLDDKGAPRRVLAPLGGGTLVSDLAYRRGTTACR